MTTKSHIQEFGRWVLFQVGNRETTNYLRQWINHVEIFDSQFALRLRVLCNAFDGLTGYLESRFEYRQDANVN